MKVLVYGTLMPGQPAYRFFNEPRDLGKVKIPGQLYDIGAFPGIKLGGVGGSRVVCSLVEADDSCLQRLDDYEGCPYLYTRQSINLDGTCSAGEQGSSAKGGCLEGGLAYIYEYNGDVANKRLINTGDWEKRYG